MRIVTPGGQVSPPLKGRAGRVGVRPGRTARRRHRQGLRAEQDDLFLLRRAQRQRRPHRGGARQTELRQRPPSTKQRSSSVRRGRCRPAITMAAASRRPVTATCSSRWAIISVPATRRKSRQPSGQADPDRARRLGNDQITRSSAAPMRNRKSGATAIATQQGLAIHPGHGRSLGNRARSARRRRGQPRRQGEKITAGR